MSETTTTAPDALEASVKSTRPVLTTIEVDGETFDVIRKPNLLLLSELSRTETGSVDSLSVIAEFFQSVLGRETYVKFKTTMYQSDEASDEAYLANLIQKVVEETLGRPTQ